MLRILSLVGGTAWACLCACGLLLALQGARAIHLDQEPGIRPWVDVTPSLSANGRVVAFEASRDALGESPPRAFGRPLPGGRPNRLDIVVVDLERGPVENVTGRSDGSSITPRLDGTGQHLVFASDATNLVPGVTHGMRSIYLLDRASGLLRHVPSPGPRVGYNASSSPTLSADGRWGAFSTYGLGDEDDPIRLRRPALFKVECGQAGVVNVADPRAGPTFGSPAFSPDSRRLAFAAFAPRRSSEGQLVALFSFPLGGPGEWAKTLAGPPALATMLPASASPARDGVSLAPVLSRDSCAYVCSGGSSPGRNSLQVRLRDLGSGVDECVSATPAGREGNDDSVEPSISADGRYVAFSSLASDLVADDPNQATDVFLRDRGTGTTVLVSHAPQGLAADGPSYHPSISADGQRIAYVSRASNLEGRPCARGQVFVWDRSSGSSRRVPLPPLPVSHPWTNAGRAPVAEMEGSRP